MPRQQEPSWQRFEAANTAGKSHKETRRNREPNQLRRKERTPNDFDDPEAPDELSPAESERVTFRGERVRRWDPLAEALAELEEDWNIPEYSPAAPPPSAERGIVTVVESSLCRVNADGHTFVCKVRTSPGEIVDFSEMVSVGDEVIISVTDDRAILETVLPRRSALTWPERDFDDSQQVLIANADQLLIVASWRNPAIRFELVDRYLITAARSNLAPIICINKIDLAPDRAVCRVMLQPYIDLGYQVLFTSAQVGHGLKKFKEVLRGRITALVGAPGAGKSSLLAAIQPALKRQAVETPGNNKGPVSPVLKVSLCPLAVGGFAVEAPGRAELDLSGLRQKELARFYAEIVAVEKNCQFRNCSHTHEPGCAVKTAVQQGHVSARRYQNYKQIYYTLPV